jgi:hypothetical protein
VSYSCSVSIPLPTSFSLVYESRFTSKFPDYDDAILDFIPYTNGIIHALQPSFALIYAFLVGGWSNGTGSGSRFYWAADIEDMAYKWEQLQNAVRMRVPSVKQNMENFQSRRVDLTETVFKVMTS